MKNKLNLNYFTPQTARGYQFVTVPTLLITHKAFSSIDYGAKILYGLMLNRASLSAINSDKFTDLHGRLYIVYTIEQVMADLNCKSNNTAIKFIKQLEEIGLIEKKRQGQGKPTLLFIKDFSSVDFTDNSLKCKICTSGSAKNAFQEMQNMHRSKKDNNKTDYKSINQSEQPEMRTVRNPKEQKEIDGLMEQKSIYQSSRLTTKNNSNLDVAGGHTSTQANQTIVESAVSDVSINDSGINVTPKSVSNATPKIKSTEETRAAIAAQAIREYEECDELVKMNIQYNYLVEHSGHQADIVEEIAELMIETICSKKGTVRIGGEEKPHAVVASRLKKLDVTHIEYVLDCLRANTSKIHNIRTYLLTTLYNAFTSLSNYYQQRVNYDYHEDVMRRGEAGAFV